MKVDDGEGGAMKVDDAAQKERENDIRRFAATGSSLAHLARVYRMKLTAIVAIVRAGK